VNTSKPSLRPYQADGIAWLKQAERAILADEMGLGKSRQLIEASVGRTLVVAPAMVLDGGVWVDEIAKWADDPERFETVSYSGLSTKRWGELVADTWDTLILDEAHYIKGRKSIRTERTLELGMISQRVYAATGTPIPNWAHEIFTLLKLIYPDESESAPGFKAKYGSYWRWVQDWFNTYSTRFSAYEIGSLKRCRESCKNRPANDPCEHYREFVDENLAGHFLLRRRDDVLPDLPPLTEVQVKTKMGPAQKRAYVTMKNEYLAQVEDREIVAWSAGARNVRLDRMTAGLDCVDDEQLARSESVIRADNGKLARLAEDLADRSQPTVVMAHYHTTVDACRRVAEELGLSVESVDGRVASGQRRERIRRFQSGKLDVLVGSLETLAEGLTLTVADCLIFVETSYKPSRNQQAMRRVHRLGQDRPVTILDYLTPGTVDEHKRELLAAKTDEQMRTLTAAQFKALL